MKVLSSEEAKKAIEAARAAKQERAQRHPAERSEAEQPRAARAEDRVSLNLGRLLQQELDPSAVESSRKARVEELKKLIASGEYKVSTEQAAQALAREISMEILTQGKPGKDESDSE